MLNKDTQSRIEEISNLEDNWDGYGSKPLSEGVISNVTTILNCINFDTKLFPSGRDSVQMEYFRNGDKDGIEIEVFNDKVIYSSIRDGNYIVDDDPITIEDAIALFIDFYYN